MDMDKSTSIYCDCSDCGNKRVTGKCLLEEYYYNKYNKILPEINRDRIQKSLIRDTLRKRKGYIFTIEKVTLI
jgi:hypothetical protein